MQGQNIAAGRWAAMPDHLSGLEERMATELKNVPPLQEAAPLDASDFSALLSIIEGDKDLVLKRALGEHMHRRLMILATSFDQSHPGLASMPNKLAAVKDACNNLPDFLSSLVNSAGKDMVFKALCKAFMQHKEIKEIRQLIHSTTVRFQKTPSVRQELRQKKTKKVIALESIGMGVISQAKSMELGLFVRNDDGASKFLEDFKVKSGKLRNIGCTLMAGRLENSSKGMAEIATDRYYGFTRMRMPMAAFMVAKANGCVFTDRGMVWPTDLFKGSEPWLVAGRTYDMVLPGDRGIMRGQKMSEMAMPKAVPAHSVAYPLVAVPFPISPTAKERIDLLESFPEAGGRPIFDHFWVVVPTMRGTPAHLFTYANSYCYVDGDKIVVCSDSTSQVDRLVSHLAESGRVVPFLLGEVDGKCYFLGLC